MPVITLRDVREGDRAFILSTWLRSFQYSTVLVKALSEARSWPTARHHSLASAVVDASIEGRRGAVACTGEGADEIALGYVLLGSRGEVHYCYVKRAFRSIGVASALLARCGIKPEAGIPYTHKPDVGTQWIWERWPMLAYVPEFFWNGA